MGTAGLGEELPSEAPAPEHTDPLRGSLFLGREETFGLAVLCIPPLATSRKCKEAQVQGEETKRQARSGPPSR